MSSFSIKVSDLLRNVGKQDTIQFEKQATKKIENMTAEGVSGNIALESLNEQSVEVTLTDIQCEVDDCCDRCDKDYRRAIRCDYHVATFTSKPSDFSEEAQDEIFPINNKGNIDIEEMVIQAIGLQTPMTKLCFDCINSEEENDEDEYDSSEGSIGGTISFS